MKTIIGYFKKNWIYILITLVGLTIIISMLISSYNQRRIERDLYNVELNSIRLNLIDSIAKVQSKKDIHLIDSLNSIREADRKNKDTKVLILIAENKELKKKLENAYGEFSNNVDDVAKCKDVIDIQKDIILNQDTIIIVRENQIYSYKLSLADLNKKYDVQLKETQRTKIMYDNCQDNITIIAKRLEKQTTWWKKNDKWVFLGAGLIGGIIIMK